MLQFFNKLIIKTNGPELINISEQILLKVKESKVKSGLVNLSLMHTSASLLIQEDASPDVLKDLLDFYEIIAPMDQSYRHNAEGRDDMPAHIKSSLTNSSLCISISESNLLLGRWQGIFLFEHRLAPHTREVVVHIIGQNKN
ncbi:MAG: secondary thiamine-phosphate synthase enzyme YjbQ [Pseudomonadota bacterium]|nr:secondary thiamine-phosphate synthase enzyme YjbQ [Pseudomonadota bacterium]